MNLQTLLFCDSLWKYGNNKEEVLNLVKKNIDYEIESNLKGILHPDAIFFNSRAKDKKNRLLELIGLINEATAPSEINAYLKEYQSLIGELIGFQMLTMRNLISPLGPTINNSYIFVRQLVPLAIKRIKEQSLYQMLLYCNLTGKKVELDEKLPEEGSSKWIEYYLNNIVKLMGTISDRQIDGRWKYEKKQVSFIYNLSFNQFIQAEVDYDDFECVPGKVYVISDLGKSGYKGRGFISNLTVEDMEQIQDIYINTDIKSENFIDYLVNYENLDETLKYYFNGEKYLLSPERLFTCYNVDLINASI